MKHMQKNSVKTFNKSLHEYYIKQKSCVNTVWFVLIHINMLQGCANCQIKTRG